MSKLIILELRKIFKKKSIYILLFFMGSFCFLNNLLYYLDYDDEGFYVEKESDELEEEIEKLKEELVQYDVHKDSDVSSYLEIQSKLDVLNLQKNYDRDSWQYEIVRDYFYDYFYQRNYCYYVSQDLDLLEELSQQIDEYRNKLKGDDWKFFLGLRIEDDRKKISLLKDKLNGMTDKLEIKKMNDTMNSIHDEIDELEYRIQHDIQMGNHYLNRSFKTYLENKSIVNSMKGKELSLEENQVYQDAYSKMKVNEYILSKKENIDKENTAAYQLRTITDDYDLFLVVLIFMVSSGIICEEFGRGTIKLLLIKPYSRGKIVLSKYWASFIVLMLGIIFLIGVQIVIGTLFFGFDSFRLPVIVYHFKSREIISYSVFSYMMIRIIARLPFYVMLMTICFVISVIFTNMILSMMIPMLIYMFESFVQKMMLHHFSFLKYSIFMNQHFENYLFGRRSITGISFIGSLLIYLIYFIVLFIILIEWFKKKDVKNI